MAISEFLEPAIKDYATQAKATYSAPINTDMFTGRQFVAGQDPMQTQAASLATQGVGSYSPYLTAGQTANTQSAGALGQAATAAGGLGALQSGAQGYQTAQAGMTGPNAYQPFMSPYQSQVIDATLSEFDRSRGQGQQEIRDAAVNSGNFGGGREGAMMGQYNADSLADRSALQANMLQQGFGQAQQQAQQNFANQGQLFGNQGQMMQNQLGIANAQAGLGQAQLGLSDFNRSGIGADVGALGQLGSLRQGFNQANLSANQQAQQTAAYEPYGRLSQYGQGLTGLSGGVASQSYQEPQPVNMLSQSIGTAMGLGGLYGKIFQPGFNPA